MKERDLVMLLPARVVRYHSGGQLRHGRLCADHQSAQRDVAHYHAIRLLLHCDAGQRAATELIIRHHAPAVQALLFRDKHGAHAVVRLNHHVIHAHARRLPFECQQQSVVIQLVVGRHITQLAAHKHLLLTASRRTRLAW